MLMQSCQGTKGDFIISKNKVGKLTDSTKIYQMKQLYKSDSIVENMQNASAFGVYEEYTVYDKQTRKPLLTVVPVKINDSASLIKTIEIRSDIFKTAKGICLSSEFEKIQSNTKINKVEETFKYIVLYLDEFNATIDIDKDVLPLSAQHNRSVKVDETLIPNDAKMSHFIVFMNE